jgi:UDPglucose 6-dehydrogenase
VDFSLLREVERINQARIERFLTKVRRALWVLKDKTLALWGLAFKPGTDDIREAPSLQVVQRLLQEGAAVRLYDPAAMGNVRRVVPPSDRVYYARDAYDAVEGAHALLLLTEWEEFIRADFAAVKGRMALPIIIDGRNALDPQRLKALGFEYSGMGRG